MQLNPYLSFNGDCREAFQFYAATLGGEITALLSHGESPVASDTPPELRDRIMHAAMTVNGTVLMGGDAPPGHYQRPEGICVALHIDDPAEAEQRFAALAAGGQMNMPLQETFWALRFGMLTDRFGIPWMINCARPE